MRALAEKSARTSFLNCCQQGNALVEGLESGYLYLERHLSSLDLLDFIPYKPFRLRVRLIEERSVVWVVAGFPGNRRGADTADSEGNSAGAAVASVGSAGLGATSDNLVLILVNAKRAGMTRFSCLMKPRSGSGDGAASVSTLELAREKTRRNTQLRCAEGGQGLPKIRSNLDKSRIVRLIRPEGDWSLDECIALKSPFEDGTTGQIRISHRVTWLNRPISCCT